MKRIQPEAETFTPKGTNALLTAHAVVFVCYPMDGWIDVKIFGNGFWKQLIVWTVHERYKCCTDYDDTWVVFQRHPHVMVVSVLNGEGIDWSQISSRCSKRYHIAINRYISILISMPNLVITICIYNVFLL